LRHDLLVGTALAIAGVVMFSTWSGAYASGVQPPL